MERLTFNIPSSRGPGRRRGVVAGWRPAGKARTSATTRLAGVKSRAIAAFTRERYDWDYLWMIAFTAVLFFRPQDHVAVLTPLHLAELTAVAGLAAMAVRRMASGQTIVKINAEVIGVMALGAVIVITIPFSFWPGGSLALFSDVYVKIILIFALMISTITSPRRLYQMTWLIILICGYVSVRGIFDYMRGVNLIEGDRLRGAVGGFLENPNDLAMNLIVFMAPALIIVFQDRGMIRRTIAAAIVLVMAVAIVYTKSRAGFIGIGAMGMVVVYYALRDRPAVIFALVFAALLATPVVPSTFWDRMSSITNPDEDETGSRQQRIQLYRQGLQVFAENPITGIGAGQFVNYDGDMMAVQWRVTHNVWLQVAAELGIFGLWAFGFLVWRAFTSCFAARRAIRGPTRKHPEATTTLTVDELRIIDMNAKGMLAGLVGWLVCAFFASVAFNWTFYYVFALAVAGREIARDRRVAAEPVARRAAVAAVPAGDLRGAQYAR
jgi:putative inorganic carbon (hco3(-)) transporter